MFNFLRFLVITLPLLALNPIAFACSPSDPNRSDGERLAQAFLESESVLIGTVDLVEKFTVKSRGIDMPMERVTFRVDRVFKGSLEAGGKFVVETNLSNGSCGRSVVNDPIWLPDVGPRGEFAARLTKQWVIFHYKNAGLTTNPSFPIDIFADIFPCPVERLAELIADQKRDICN